MDRNKMKFLPSTSSKKFPNLLETEWNAGGKIRDRQIYLSESASNKERRDHEVSSRRASRPSIWHRGGRGQLVQRYTVGIRYFRRVSRVRKIRGCFRYAG